MTRLWLRSWKFFKSILIFFMIGCDGKLSELTPMTSKRTLYRNVTAFATYTRAQNGTANWAAADLPKMLKHVEAKKSNEVTLALETRLQLPRGFLAVKCFRFDLWSKIVDLFLKTVWICLIIFEFIKKCPVSLGRPSWHPSSKVTKVPRKLRKLPVKPFLRCQTHRQKLLTALPARHRDGAPSGNGQCDDEIQREERDRKISFAGQLLWIG